MIYAAARGLHRAGDNKIEICRGGRPCPPGRTQLPDRTMRGDLVESAKITVGAGFYPARAVQYRGWGRTNANTFPVCRGRCRALPTRGTSVLTIRCGKFAIAPRADRGVRPYRALCIFADGAYNFVIAPRRVDVGIDPYGDFAWSPVVVRVCFAFCAGGVEPLPYADLVDPAILPGCVCL